MLNNTTKLGDAFSSIPKTMVVSIVQSISRVFHPRGPVGNAAARASIQVKGPTHISGVIHGLFRLLGAITGMNSMPAGRSYPRNDAVRCYCYTLLTPGIHPTELLRGGEIQMSIDGTSICQCIQYGATAIHICIKKYTCHQKLRINRNTSKCLHYTPLILKTFPYTALKINLPFLYL